MKTSPCRKLAPAGSSPDPIMMPNVEHPGHQSCCDLMLLLSTPEDSVSLAVWSSPHLCSIEVTPYDLRDHKDSKIFIFQPSKWNCQSHPLHVFSACFQHSPPKKKTWSEMYCSDPGVSTYAHRRDLPSAPGEWRRDSHAPKCAKSWLKGRESAQFFLQKMDPNPVDEETCFFAMRWNVQIQGKMTIIIIRYN